MFQAYAERMSHTLRFMTRRKRPTRSIWGNMVNAVMLGLVGIFMAFPLIFAVIQAFKPIDEIFVFPPRFFVRRPTLDNFADVFQIVQNSWVPLYRYVFNSLLISVGGTTIYIVIASLAAYPLAKHQFPGKALYMNLIIWMLLFRPEVTGIPQYILISKLGMVNTYFAIILPALAGTFGVFLMRQFMINSIPNETLESARIDGANEFKIFWSIVMPSVKPAWLTLLIFTFQALWNSTGVQYIYDENLKMLPVVLEQIVQGGISRAGAGSAVALLLMIPPIVIFVIAQSSVMETMSHSGLK